VASRSLIWTSPHRQFNDHRGLTLVEASTAAQLINSLGIRRDETTSVSEGSAVAPSCSLSSRLDVQQSHRPPAPKSIQHIKALGLPDMHFYLSHSKRTSRTRPCFDGPAQVAWNKLKLPSIGACQLDQKTPRAVRCPLPVRACPPNVHFWASGR
jgi:hypothetical protein